MRATLPFLSCLPWLLLLASCNSPPKPPTVDESQKRPVNAQMAVELQVCKNDLQNTRLLAIESGRLAESTAATLATAAARQQLLAAMQTPAIARPVAQPTPAPANPIYTVYFDFASTRVAMPAHLTAAVVEDARSSPLVLLRGRTDGSSDAPAESRIARERAAVVREQLVAAGVDPARIRITYQPSGDHVADNDSPDGRSLNRRVEIELYRALPVARPAPAALAGPDADTVLRTAALPSTPAQP